jgi:MSHA biogenesis protein MshN
VLEEIPPELPMPVSRLSAELAVPPLPAASPDNADSKNAKDAKSVKAKDRVMDLTATAQPAKEHDKAPPVVAANVPPPVQPALGELPLKRVSPAQLADAEFRKAAALMQQGRIADAIGGYEAALQLDAGHQAARQALVALLLEGKRNADAERVLQDGLQARPDVAGFAMLLARLQVERGALEQAVATLEKSLPQAGSQGDYHAFLAALQQRQNRHDDALGHYRIALQQAPGNGRWLMGCGISLQAAQRGAEAKEFFQRALDSKTLSPELQAFVQQKLKEL